MKSLGCSVSGICSTKHKERMNKMGVERIFDYSTKEIGESKEQYDIVLDCVSGVNETPQVCIQYLHSIILSLLPK